MPGYLDEELVTQLNNLPGFPRGEDVALGDVLNTVLNVGDPAKLTASIETIYVEAPVNGGSDTTGDGSAASPYATPQKAYDSIPARAGSASTLYYQIQCGAGTFVAPVLDHVALDGVYVVFVGNRDAAVAIPTTGAFSTVGGRAVRSRASTAGYAGTVNRTTHWLEIDYGIGVLFPPWGGALADSSTPNLDAPPPRYGFSGAGSDIARPFETIFEIQDNPSTFTGGIGPSRPLGASDARAFVGIKFSQATGGTSITALNCSFYGCLIADDATSVWYARNCVIASAIGSGSLVVGGDCVVDGAVTGANVLGMAGGNAFSQFGQDLFSVIAGGGITLYNGAQVRCRKVDFDALATHCFTLRAQASLEVVLSGGGVNHYVGAGRTSYLTANMAYASFAGSGTVAGAITGTAVTLTNGAQVTGIETPASGNLTASVAEIVVGGNAGANFSTLPATDIGASAPQLCRGT